MSIWDSIGDGITSLFDDVGDAFSSGGSNVSLPSGSASSGWFGTDSPDSDFLSTVAKNTVKGAGALEKQQQAKMSKDETTYKFLERNMRMMPVDPDQNAAPVHLRGAMSGAQNFSVDAASLQSYWNQVLKGFVQQG